MAIKQTHERPSNPRIFPLNSGSTQEYFTLDDVRQRFAPPVTLPANDKARLACDSAMEACGGYTLLQHSINSGMMPQASFLGYSALQQISQNGLIRACIETVTDDLTRAGIDLQRDGEPEYPNEVVDRLADLQAEMRRLKVQEKLHEAAGLCGYMGGSFIYIDTGEANPEMLQAPLTVSEASTELAPDKPLRFIVIDPINITPGYYNSSNPLEEDYFTPRTWYVLGREIHASRLIRIVANEVPTLLKPAYNFLGLAQAQILWDYVMHFNECRISAQRLLNKFSLTVMKTDMFNRLLAPEGTAELDNRVKYFVKNRSNDGVVVIDKEAEDLVKLETPLGGATDIVRQALEILAAMNRTPAVKLLGISPSGFNATGESDIRNYYDHIASLQNKMLRPAIEQIVRLLQVKLFRSIDHSVTFDFSPLSETDRAATATTQKMLVDMYAVLLDRGVISADEARKVLAEDPDSGFTDLEADDVPLPPEGEGIETFNAEPSVPVDDVDKAGAVY